MSTFKFSNEDKNRLTTAECDAEDWTAVVDLFFDFLLGSGFVVQRQDLSNHFSSWGPDDDRWEKATEAWDRFANPGDEPSADGQVDPGPPIGGLSPPIGGGRDGPSSAVSGRRGSEMQDNTTYKDPSDGPGAPTHSCRTAVPKS